MLVRIVTVTAIASFVFLLGVPEDALACHKGDPRFPHGAQTSCDGGGGDVPTNFVLVDGTGNVVGPVLGFDPSATLVYVSVPTPNRGQIFLRVSVSNLQNNRGFDAQGGPRLFFENLGCPEADTAYLFPKYAVPNVFPEDGLIRGGVTFTLELWIGTSFESQPVRVFLSRRRDTGVCKELDPPITIKLGHSLS